jgi:hypothetical protein
LEESFKNTEKQVRTLVANLVKEMWAQQRRMIGIKQYIQQYGQKEGMVDKGIVPSLDERASSVATTDPLSTKSLVAAPYPKRAKRISAYLGTYVH